jgi:hypothetical protein
MEFLACLELVFILAAQVGLAEPPQCRNIDASLSVSPATASIGTPPTFTIALKNVSNESVRLLDLRDSRRADLTQTYYELVFEQNGRALTNLRRVISDPGPIDASNFFLLPAGGSVKAALTTPIDLRSLPEGHYSAHIRITLNPLSAPVPPCRSTRVSFSVIR